MNTAACLLLNTSKTDEWVKDPISKRVIKGMSLVLQPEPRFELNFLKNLIHNYYPLPEYDYISLVPNASDHIHPNTFPNQILFICGLEQIKIQKVHLKVVMLDCRCTYPLKALRPYLLGIFAM